MAEKKNTKRLAYIVLLLFVLIPLAYYVGYEIGKNAAERHNPTEKTE